jgi:hypothetical protein
MSTAADVVLVAEAASNVIGTKAAAYLISLTTTLLIVTSKSNCDASSGYSSCCGMVAEVTSIVIAARTVAK